MFKRAMSLMLAILLAASACPLKILAAQGETTALEAAVHINPVYQDILTVEDLVQPAGAGRSAAATQINYCASYEAAAEALRQQMKERKTTISIGLTLDVPATQDIFDEACYEISDIAFAHTGVGNEGDYLLWQYGGWICSGKISSSKELLITYTMTYYTTAAQEAQVDAKIEKVLDSLDLYAATNYEIVKGIYDYICTHVTYDYENLSDQTNFLKHTAYAALIEGKAVCQGYAVLFYRMALEMGVDARYISGYAGGDAHGWNIVKLGNRYYDVDVTWDAGEAKYRWFLLGSDHFENHTPDPEYATAEFLAKYPVSSTNYVTDCDHVYVPEEKQEPTCTEQGYTRYICTCGDSYKDTYVAALGHSWDDGVVTTQPTEEAEGVKTYTCGRCGETKTETLSKLDHVHAYTETITAPTCTAQGYTTHTCACGDSYIDTYVNALGHDYTLVFQKDPTVTDTGYTGDQVCTVCHDTIPGEVIPALGITFTDVDPNKWYATPVSWAVSNGITSGTSATTFGPNDSCTRAQVVMFLWAANERPAPTSTTNPFSDIQTSKYYYNAVLWAVEQGITGGAGNGTFAPDRVVTRSEFVTMLWTALGKPAVSVANPFTDVAAGKWYTTPVLWAYANGITSGMKDGTFGVNEPCTRAQVVTFLYSAYGK